MTPSHPSSYDPVMSTVPSETALSRRLHRVTTGKQRGRLHREDPVELAERFAAMVVADAPIKRPPWESGAWWVDQADRYPERDCGKNVTHGPARLRYQTGFAGRSLGWFCTVCGWDLPVLVQEGAHEPCPPSSAEQLTSFERDKLETRAETARRNGALGYNARANTERTVTLKDRFEQKAQATVDQIEHMLAEGHGRLSIGALLKWAKVNEVPRRALAAAKDACGLRYRRSGIRFTWEGFRD